MPVRHKSCRLARTATAVKESTSPACERTTGKNTTPRQDWPAKRRLHPTRESANANLQPKRMPRCIHKLQESSAKHHHQIQKKTTTSPGHCKTRGHLLCDAL